MDEFDATMRGVEQLYISRMFEQSVVNLQGVAHYLRQTDLFDALVSMEIVDAIDKFVEELKGVEKKMIDLYKEQQE